MAIYVNPEDQKKLDSLRIALSVTTIDLTEVKANDPVSQAKKNAVIKGLAAIRKNLDDLGLVHTIQKGQQRAAS